jgi:hypothetical protein
LHGIVLVEDDKADVRNNMVVMTFEKMFGVRSQHPLSQNLNHVPKQSVFSQQTKQVL